MHQKKIKRVITALACMIAALCLQGCAQKRESTPSMNKGEKQVQAPGVSQAGGTAPSDQARRFRGTIDYKHKIEMRLARVGDSLTGTYVYEKVGTDINLKGTIDGKGNFTLQESDGSGKQTGEFEGVWRESEAEPGATLEGRWAKAGGGEKVDFYLVEQFVDFVGAQKIVAREIKEDNEKRKYSLNAEYPQIEGSADPHLEQFNKEVSGWIKKEVDEWKETAGRDPGEEDDSPGMGEDEMTIRYDVRLATNDLVSLQFNVSVYEHGAAHPSSYSKVINYDLKNGRRLNLADLFQPQADYLQEIASYSINDLKRRSQQEKPDERLLNDQDIEEGAAAKADNYQSWNITQKGLLITFDAYQVGPYAAGPQTVVVPYSALKKMIRTDGPLAPFAR